MRKVIVMLVLTAMAGSAMAKWVEVSGDSASTVFVDRASIKRTGKTVKMWVMIDLKNVHIGSNGVRTQSFKTLKEFDCTNGLHRAINAIAYAGKSGEGSITLRVDTPSDYLPIDPGSKDERTAAIACKTQ